MKNKPVIATEGFPSDVLALQEELQEALRRYNTLVDYVNEAWDIIDGAGDIDSVYSAVYQVLERANAFLNFPKGVNQYTDPKDKTIESLETWIADLQSGMYINCVYCGHRYGPNDEVPASMADVLKRHIEVCPKHPMSALAEELRQLREAAAFAGNTIRNGKPYESLDDDEKHALDWLNTLLPAEKGEHDAP